jgi:hypothetical protein
MAASTRILVAGFPLQFGLPDLYGRTLKWLPPVSKQALHLLKISLIHDDLLS